MLSGNSEVPAGVVDFDFVSPAPPAGQSRFDQNMRAPAGGEKLCIAPETANYVQSLGRDASINGATVIEIDPAERIEIRKKNRCRRRESCGARTWHVGM